MRNLHFNFYVFLAAVFTVACLAMPAHTSAGQYLIFKGHNVSQSCLDTLVVSPSGGLVSTQPLLFSCSTIEYRDSDTLVYDEATNDCLVFDDFVATTSVNTEDTLIQYTNKPRTLQDLVNTAYVSDSNAVLAFDGDTGEVFQSESSICDEEATPPPPPAAPINVDNFQELIASDGALSDQFGISVDVDGDRAVIGARFEDNGGFSNNGAAYVFYNDPADNPDMGWVEEKRLDIPGGGSNQWFGHTVGIEGNVVVVGAPFIGGMTAWVFTRDPGTGLWDTGFELDPSGYRQRHHCCRGITRRHSGYKCGGSSHF
jgi:hypothetical protein